MSVRHTGMSDRAWRSGAENSEYNGETILFVQLTLTVLVMTIDAQWEGMGDVWLARYELALLLPCLTIRVLSYSN